ncbi:MAG: CHRD domain-containing protein [Actinomycetota bacterium]
MKRLTIVMSVMALLVIGAAPALSQGPHENFRTHLSGENEVPAVDTQAQGQAIFQLSADGESLDYKLIVANIENVIMAHIHIGDPNENGPVAVWLYPEDGPPPVLIEGRTQGVLAEGTITEDDLTGPLEGASMDDLMDAIRAGNTYVNVHTTQNMGGEVRGQIR